MLKPVNHERFKTYASEYLVIVNLNFGHCAQTFYFAKQDERAKVVVAEYDLL